ncbi:MAG: hypothetical protein KDD69_16620 [Bdellovibrionales bacterium]|nr:hypothetical protein [Bdellovibrionales bacterium]
MTTTKGSDYTFILKVAVILVVAWAFLYRPQSAESPEGTVAPDAQSTSAVPPDTQANLQNEPPPTLVAALAVDQPRDVSSDQFDTIPDGSAAALLDEIIDPTAQPKRRRRREPLPPPQHLAPAAEQATAPADTAPDQQPEGDAGLIEVPRDLLSLRDSAFIEEVEQRAIEERERLKQEYEARLSASLEEEKKKLAQETDKLSELYESEIRQLQESAKEKEEALQSEIAKLQAEAQRQEVELRRQLAEFKQQAKNESTSATQTPRQGNHAQKLTMRLRWGATCGLLDRATMAREFEASPEEPLYLSIEPLLTDDKTFDPLRVQVQPSRFLLSSSTELTFYTGDEPLSLGVFLCKDTARDGRCLHKPAFDPQRIAGTDAAYHRADKSYAFSYLLVFKDKMYLLDPSQGEAFYRKLEKALTLLSVPPEKIAATVKSIRTVDGKLSPSAQQLRDREIVVTFPEQMTHACHRP